MKDDGQLFDGCDQRLDILVAELTAAVYPVALRHGVAGKWLDLELDLWRALAATVKDSARGFAYGV
jgi:hypothetical protein